MTDGARVAWIGAVSASLLPFRGCRSGTACDRALAGARSSADASARRSTADTPASGREQDAGQIGLDRSEMLVLGFTRSRFHSARRRVATAGNDKRAKSCRGLSAEASEGGEQVPGAELVAALCLATDLGVGFPFERVALHHADRDAARRPARVDRSTALQTHPVCLLSHTGCTTDAPVKAEILGDSLATHFNRHVRAGREMLSGLSVPDGSAIGRRPVRALRVARVAEASARVVSATCKMAAMLAATVVLFRRWRVYSPTSPSAGRHVTAPRVAWPAVDRAWRGVFVVPRGSAAAAQGVAGEPPSRRGRSFSPRSPPSRPRRGSRSRP